MKFLILLIHASILYVVEVAPVILREFSPWNADEKWKDDLIFLKILVSESVFSFMMPKSMD